MVPLADPELLEHICPPASRRADYAGVSSLVRFLRDHHRQERFLLAGPDIHYAAPIIIETGEAAMAYGGFMGSDPILNAEQFAKRVESGELRFVLLRAGPQRGRGPALSREDIATWVRTHGREVPSHLWRPRSSRATADAHRPLPWGPVSAITGMMFESPSLELYDCRPARGSEAPSDRARSPAHDRNTR
jgi:hypothetical protein